MELKSRTLRAGVLAWLFLAIVPSPGASADETWSSGVRERLETLGFEWVQIEETGSRAVVRYENRVFRYEIRALGEVALAAISGLDPAVTLVIVSMNRGVPVAGLSAPAGDWQAFMSGTLDTPDFRSRVRALGTSVPDMESSAPAGSTSRFKVDIGVRPLADVQLGIADNPFELGVWLAPEATMSLSKGSLITGQVIVKIRDEFDAFAPDAAPGRTTLSVWGRLPGSVTGVVSAGYFPGNRYGIAWEAGRFAQNGWLEFRLAGDYSGFLKFSKGNRALYSDLKAWTGLASVIVRSPSIDLELNLTGGRFIHGDRGVRIDLLRHFRETDFGFFAVKTNEGSVGGFRFSVALPVERQLKPARLRPVTVPSFPFEYREDQEPTGKRVRLFDNLDRLRKGLTPMYLLNNLDALRSSASGEPQN